MLVERKPQRIDCLGQWIAEIFVLAGSETVPCHHHAAPETLVGIIERGERIADCIADQAARQREPVTVEIIRNLRPIQRIHTTFENFAAFPARHRQASLGMSAATGYWLSDPKASHFLRGIDLPQMLRGPEAYTPPQSIRRKDPT